MAVVYLLMVCALIRLFKHTSQILIILLIFLLVFSCTSRSDFRLLPSTAGDLCLFLGIGTYCRFFDSLCF